MKRIILKDKSPEFADRMEKHGGVRLCDAPGCRAEGAFRAPKDRGLKDYYIFCRDHVAAYNQTWDFFDGMSDIDIEAHIRASMMGDRPTWRYDSAPDMEEALRKKAFQWRGEEEKPKSDRKKERMRPEGEAPEIRALEVLGLYPPTDLLEIKKRYKELAKKHHPDMNPGNAEAEELLKQINMAYTVLKVAYESFEKMEM